MKSRINRLTSATMFAVTATIFSVSAQPNSVLSLNGTSSYVSIPTGPELQNPNGLTIEGWINPSQNPRGGGGVLSKSDGLDCCSKRTYQMDWLTNGMIALQVFFALPVGANQPTFAAIQARIAA